MSDKEMKDTWNFLEGYKERFTSKQDSIYQF